MVAQSPLSADALIGLVRTGLAQVPDPRADNSQIDLGDALMGGFAVFVLKDPSLLAFEERRLRDGNLRRLFKMDQVPCDTQMRTLLDEVDPDSLRPVFQRVHRELAQNEVLRPYVFLEGSYLLALDGTGYFSSKKVHCDTCQQKVNSKTGEVTYYHQLLAGAIIHPARREVLPVMPEPIQRADGEDKNDCERNAAKRFLDQLHQDYPHRTFTLTEDALSPNAPHLRELFKHQYHFILGVKPGDHAALFAQVALARQDDRTIEYAEHEGQTLHRFSFINGMLLNQSSPDVRVNFVEYWESKAGKTQHFSWVTDFTVTSLNVASIMRGGRARWKIENETFNTLKNQGYHFEHNFGHGQKHLAVVFAVLMLLAFLVDQIQQLGDGLFQALLKKSKRLIRVRERMRAFVDTLELQSMAELYQALLAGRLFQVELGTSP